MPGALKQTLIWSGIATIVGPILGLLGTAIGMIYGYQALGQTGVANSEGLSSSISIVLIATITGCAIGLIGLLTLITTLILQLSNRK